MGAVGTPKYDTAPPSKRPEKGLMGIRKAKSKEVRRLTADSLAVAPSAPSVVVDRVYLPERNKRTQLFTGDPKLAAAQLIEKLKFEVRAI